MGLLLSADAPTRGAEGNWRRSCASGRAQSTLRGGQTRLRTSTLSSGSERGRGFTRAFGEANLPEEIAVLEQILPPDELRMQRAG